MPPAGLGGMLDPVQTYCVANKLPPLTVLVVQKDTGLPGSGFTAAQAAQVASDQARAFDFNWLIPTAVKSLVFGDLTRTE